MAILVRPLSSLGRLKCTCFAGITHLAPPETSPPSRDGPYNLIILRYIAGHEMTQMWAKPSPWSILTITSASSRLPFTAPPFQKASRQQHSGRAESWPSPLGL